jgi:hypothetical protein
MQSFIFKQAVIFRFGPKSSKSVRFAKGSHRVQPEILELPYFKKLQKAGLVVSSSQPVAPPKPLEGPSSAVIEQQKKAVERAKADGKAKLEEAAKDEFKPSEDGEAPSFPQGKKGKK